jgi:hypothetical protein
LRVPRIVPYVAGLLVLAFALGSLPRGSSGGSLLFQSYWLLYLVYLGPVVILGAMIALIVIIGLSYRDLGAALGYGIAKRRLTRKRRSRYSTAVAMFFWALAIGVLIQTKGSIFNPTRAVNSTITAIVGRDTTAPPLIQTGGIVPAISNLVQNPLFSFVFVGLLAVVSLVVVQTLRVAYKETHDDATRQLQEIQELGLQAVHEAIKLVSGSASDPRTRIIASYQHLIATVYQLGTPISQDLTARELDRAIRSTLDLKGPATSDLTKLFEEARYSLHEITDGDANKAHEYLESVKEELKVQLEKVT